jgi:ABC-type sugar transport system ATPase subunit
VIVDDPSPRLCSLEKSNSLPPPVVTEPSLEMPSAVRVRCDSLEPPRDVSRRPASRFVARFIGSPEINLLDGRTSGGRVEAGPLALELAAAAAADGDLTIGIRPDAILRADGPLPARTSGPVRARVDVVELLGSAACVHLDVDGTELRMLVPEDEVDRDPEGAWIDVVIDLDRVHLFDADGDRAR